MWEQVANNRKRKAAVTWWSKRYAQGMHELDSVVFPN